MKLRISRSQWCIGLIVMICILWIAGTALADRNGIVQLTGDVTVEEDEVIHGNVSALAGDITIKGSVNGNVVATAGTVKIFGKVDGNVQALAGNIYVRNTGIVTGDATAVAGHVDKDDSAMIGGSIVEMAEGNHLSDEFWINPILTWGALIWGCLTMLISWFAVGALLMLFFSKQIVRVGMAIKERLAYYFFVGFGTYILVPVIFILLLITVIGIPVALMLIPLVIVATIFGQLGVVRGIGNAMIERFGWKWNTEMARVMLGSVVLLIGGLIPVIGWLFFFATACMGIGGVVIHRFGIEKKEA